MLRWNRIAKPGAKSGSILISNRIRDLREAAHLTLDDLASKARTTNQQISHLELGKRKLTLDWIMRLAAALDCHPWALVSEGLDIAQTPDERQLLKAYRTADDSERKQLLLYAATTTRTP